MKKIHSAHPLRIFWISALLTILIGAYTTHQMGIAGLWVFVVLLILEVTFSFDNAVINSKILERMSPFWQRLFLTVGIIFAVFIIRFILPIAIVMISSGLGFTGVIDMALNDSKTYA